MKEEIRELAEKVKNGDASEEEKIKFLNLFKDVIEDLNLYIDSLQNEAYKKNS